MNDKQQKIELLRRAKQLHPEMTKDQARELLTVWDQRRQQKQPKVAPKKKEGVLGKGVKTLFRAINIPSEIMGGAISEGGKAIKGGYQPPKLGTIKTPTINGVKEFELGKLIHPSIVGAYRGLKQNMSVQEELPKAIGVKPNSLTGTALGFAGELATPDLTDALAGLKLGKKAIGVITETKPGKLFSKLAEKLPTKSSIGVRLEKTGKELPLKVLRPNPSQLRKFEQKTKQSVADFLKKHKISKNFEEESLKAIDLLQEEFDDIALKSGRQIRADKVINRFNKKIKQLTEGLKGISPKNKKLAKEINQWKKNLIKAIPEIQKKGHKFTIEDLTELRRIVDDGIPDNQWMALMMGNEVGGAMKVRMLLNDIIQDATKGLKTKSGMNLKEVGKELKSFHALKDIAIKQKNLGKGAHLFGLLSRVLTGAGGAALGIKGALGGLALDALLKNPTALNITSKGMDKLGKYLQKDGIQRVSKNPNQLIQIIQQLSKTGIKRVPKTLTRPLKGESIENPLERANQYQYQ